MPSRGAPPFGAVTLRVSFGQFSPVTRHSSSRQRRGLRRKLRRAGWKTALVSVSVLVVGGLVTAALLQARPGSTVPAAAPTTTTTSEVPAEPLTVAFLGDFYTGGSGMVALAPMAGLA